MSNVSKKTEATASTETAAAKKVKDLNSSNETLDTSKNANSTKDAGSPKVDNSKTTAEPSVFKLNNVNIDGFNRKGSFENDIQKKQWIESFGQEDYDESVQASIESSISLSGIFASLKNLKFEGIDENENIIKPFLIGKFFNSKKYSATSYNSKNKNQEAKKAEYWAERNRSDTWSVFEKVRNVSVWKINSFNSIVNFNTLAGFNMTLLLDSSAKNSFGNKNKTSVSTAVSVLQIFGKANEKYYTEDIDSVVFTENIFVLNKLLDSKKFWKSNDALAKLCEANVK